MAVRFRHVVSAFAFVSAVLAFASLGAAAQTPAGVISGTISGLDRRPIAAAQITVSAPGRDFQAVSDAQGRFTISAAPPGNYTIAVRRTGYARAFVTGVVVTAGRTASVDVQLQPALATIGVARAQDATINAGGTAESFTLFGAAAQARVPAADAAGLGAYLAGTVQGAAAAVPGALLDPFGNVVLRGGKVSDTIFEVDGVPVPQGLIAEPGGNIVGAQLATTGIASTVVTTSGYRDQADNALGGVVNQIPAVGTFPSRTTIELSDGAGALHQSASVEDLWATPDLRWRYAVAASAVSEYLPYGDGHTFYPAEAATYGLALQTRGAQSASFDVHFQPDKANDVSLYVLSGGAAYQQYDSPYAGQTVGAFDGMQTVYPGEVAPGAPVGFASGVRGWYDVAVASWLHHGARTDGRLQLYRTDYGSVSGGPFWDDLSFPDGVISLSATQGAHVEGIAYQANPSGDVRHAIVYGAIARMNASALDQVVPTADEVITSHPAVLSYLGYLGDTWHVTPQFDLSATARLNGAHLHPSDGPAYDVSAVDPHVAAAYRIGSGFALRAAFDRTTTVPLPLDVDRTDTTNPAPFVPLAPESQRLTTISLDHGGPTTLRLTYYDENDANRIDVLPYNFRSAVAAGENPGGVGVPTNAGVLRAHGADLWLRRGGLTLDASFIRGASSSASQFAYNGLNPAAVAAGALYPLAYVPDLSATLAYEFTAAHGRVRVRPTLSYQTGYPYGNGTEVWIFDPATHQPVEVPNDNYVNPGYNYYFLRNPALPYNPVSNPYIGSLGTPEGDGPNSLRTPPQLLVSLHAEVDVSRRVTLALDVSNLFGVSTPTALQSNPYLIGPPGYTGGNPLYGAAYAAAAGFAAPYVLGNGVPTNDGVTPAVPWSYGTAGYVPQSYPLARTLWVTLRYHF